MFIQLKRKETSAQNVAIKDQQRAKYFECLHEICTKYKPTQLFSAFTSGQFLEDILKLTLVSDWSSRRKAHDILHLLLDKYQLLGKIRAFKPNLFAFGSSSSSTADLHSVSSSSAIVRIKDNNNSGGKMNKSSSMASTLYNKSSAIGNSNHSLNKRPTLLDPPNTSCEFNSKQR